MAFSNINNNVKTILTIVASAVAGAIIYAATNSNSVALQVNTVDGRVKWEVTGSGTTTQSGSLNVRGSMSGAGLTVSGRPFAAIGQAMCWKTGGVPGYCSTTPTNGTCTCN